MLEVEFEAHFHFRKINLKTDMKNLLKIISLRAKLNFLVIGKQKLKI